MKKSELKDGMVVEFRNGKRCMFISEMGFFVGDKVGVDVTLLNRDLDFDNANFKEYGVVKVFKPIKNGCFSDILSKSHELIWERKEVETLTQDQHDKLRALLSLGYNWISRDKDGESFSYDLKPVKGYAIWFGNGDYIRINTFDIPFIKWEEDEPRSIEELLKLEIKGE